MSTIAIIDYGVGNLFSLASSLKAVGAKAIVTGDPDEIKKSDKLILPGVGAFEDAAKKLKTTGLDEIIKEEAASGKPLMGICLGMQLLFERSYEFGVFEGLGLIEGSIVPIADHAPAELKIPHIGWNKLELKKQDCPIFKYLSGGEFVYFVHSFFGTDCEADTAATTEYGCVLTAAVAKKNVYGCQFHPEKSGEVGLKILKAFSEI
ncbi:MAG: imidazole glycerol phosphate synthase subunit HisH [Oscillospiraceae bacterium]|nr:imidazole glycerol phosphate synthase subunit HisH [Oscillospiraceae bacterium]